MVCIYNLLKNSQGTQKLGAPGDWGLPQRTRHQRHQLSAPSQSPIVFFLWGPTPGQPPKHAGGGGCLESLKAISVLF